MDKNTELCSSILYFVDEAIGFRKSIHHFHRWIETKDPAELESLIIEIGLEHFVDLRGLVSAVNENDVDAVNEALDRINLYGFFKSESNFDKIKSMLDKNLSIKTIVRFLNLYLENSTLLSCVIKLDIILLGNALGFYYPANTKHIAQLALTVHTNRDLNWKDALSRNQVKSKKWLLNKLSSYLTGNKRGNIFAGKSGQTTTIVVGGWVGLLPFLASMQEVNLGKVLNVDIDSSVHTAAKDLNVQFNPMYSNVDTDVRLLDFFKYKNPMVIDTIVEHFENHGEWVKTLPAGTEVVLQGNNMFDVADHVNCHSSLSQFVKSCGLSKIKWQGELVLHKCNRYMVIGTV